MILQVLLHDGKRVYFCCCYHYKRTVNNSANASFLTQELSELLASTVPCVTRVEHTV